MTEMFDPRVWKHTPNPVPRINRHMRRSGEKPHGWDDAERVALQAIDLANVSPALSHEQFETEVIVMAALWSQRYYAQSRLDWLSTAWHKPNFCNNEVRHDREITVPVTDEMKDRYCGALLPDAARDQGAYE